MIYTCTIKTHPHFTPLEVGPAGLSTYVLPLLLVNGQVYNEAHDLVSRTA